jgi:hypothetical protein
MISMKRETFHIPDYFKWIKEHMIKVKSQKVLELETFQPI